MDTSTELLVYAKDRPSAERLASMLEDTGHAVDIATDQSMALNLFYQRGGHAMLLITPSVGSGEAKRLLHSIRAVDPAIEAVVFGDTTLRSVETSKLHRIRTLFPGSRAGIGAVQKILCNRPDSDAGKSS